MSKAAAETDANIVPVWSSHVGGHFVTAEVTRPLRNPAHPGEIVAYAGDATKATLDHAVAMARDAFRRWSALPAQEREGLLLRFLDEIARDGERIAHQMTLEQGKILAEARGEVAKAVGEGRFMLGEAQRHGAEAMPSQRLGGINLIARRPYGVVAAINPWNFPVSTPMRKIMPALVAGNAILLKPSELTPGPLCLLAEAAARAGLPEGLVGVVLGDGATIGAALLAHEGVDMITFTGSTAIGRQIAVAAAGRLLPVQLEMGGKNAAIVTRCADIAQAAGAITKAALACSGQRCTAISRVLADASILQELTQALRGQFEQIRLGPGMEPLSTMGPLVSAEHRDKVHAHVERARGEGARILTGGVAPDRAGHFYPPTLIDEIAPGAAIVREEVFGPVVTLQGFGTLDEAVALHETTQYGLTAAVFTRDSAALSYLRERLVTGMLHVNAGTFPENNMPFAGARASGFGPPSVGRAALDGFTRIQALYL